MCIPRSNGVETLVSTSFQREIHVVCLQEHGSVKTRILVSFMQCGLLSNDIEMLVASENI